MDLIEQWLSKVLAVIKTSPPAANFCFGLVLFCFEKIVEIEFLCPCSPTWNRLLASAFFVVPALIVFMLMCVIKGRDFEDPWTYVLYVTVPSITWLVIVFLDGRYYACARTSWSGKYEIIDSSEPQHWCKPANSTEERLIQTQGWYAESQVRKNLMFAKVLHQSII